MEYIVIGICIVAIVAIGARMFFKPKSKASAIPTVSASSKADEELSLSSPQSETAQDLVIQVEMLPAEAISGESSLVEITDSKVLARVNNLIPNLAQAGNAVNNAVQAVQAQGEVLSLKNNRLKYSTRNLSRALKMPPISPADMPENYHKRQNHRSVRHFLHL